MMEAVMEGGMEGSSRMDITDTSHLEMVEAAMEVTTTVGVVEVEVVRVVGITTGRVGRILGGRVVPIVTTVGGTRMIMETMMSLTGTRVLAMWRST